MILYDGFYDYCSEKFDCSVEIRKYCKVIGKGGNCFSIGDKFFNFGLFVIFCFFGIEREYVICCEFGVGVFVLVYFVNNFYFLVNNFDVDDDDDENNENVIMGKGCFVFVYYKCYL